MARTILITGAASGIGRATAALCEAAGDRVIGADIRDAEIEADLGTAEGRAKLVAEAERLAPGGLDAVLAGAGISKGDMPRETIAINYFGAVATLEGLRPLLAKSERPRAVAICSTAAMLPGNDGVVESCLAGNEAQALERIAAAPQTAYPDSKRALARWVRQTAGKPEWAGAGILLNGVGPGVVETPMTAPLLQMPEMVEMIHQSNPIAVEGYAAPEEIAELLGFLLGFRNHYLVGQIIYIDGGTDIILRPGAI
ncbi:MAG: SDR family oxidoreductase [Novosphingobium sp.]|nr:SDR family oxidoreductase [Novosphingobium sp.]